MKPRPGTAEIRHTPLLPYRTVTLPPCEGTVCRPAPPRSQSTPGRGAPVGGVCVAALAGTGLGEGGADEGCCVTDGEGLVEALAVGEACVGPGLPACQAGGVSMTTGAERAAGGLWLVDPTTNWTVARTAVTLAAVHDSHMSR
ncbi:hypothetical protein EF912_03415 [Streptomyces sp. WAC07061]|nr:hypothetical protein EF912_03415 [Streptomyces sp. WAC07061]